MDEYLKQFKEYLREAASRMPSHYKITYETDNITWSLGPNGEIVYQDGEPPQPVKP